MKRERPEWQSPSKSVKGKEKYGMYLSSPYNAGFIAEMKEVVPADDRKWIDLRKQWWISDAWLDEVDDLLFKYFEAEGYGRED